MVSSREGTRIQLCGRLSVELEGVELAGALRGKQVPLLLAYLVLRRRHVVGRDELAGALWPENAPRSQDAALRTLLSRLRSVLGSQVLVGRDELTLELPEPAWVDLEVAVSEVGRARQALERGDGRSACALAQVPLNIASRGLLPGARAPWLEDRRRELADVRLQALEVIGRGGLSLGGSALGSVERSARALIASEPYRESGYVLLMQALQAQGNVAEGLRVFDRLRRLLREELGTLPSPGAIAAHDELLNPATRVSASRPRVAGEAVSLPPELRARGAPPLVGRRRELAELEGWLAAGEQAGSGSAGRSERVLLLTGDPGVGKTRLLAEVARRAHGRGTVVLAGRAPEETLVAFQPFLEALGHYVAGASLPGLRDVAREYGAELSRLLPELRRRLPELPAPEPAESETERYRLFEAVAGLLGEISVSMPVLIVLDDLHWADRPTLLLLRHLARAPEATRISVLGAYPTTERRREGFDLALDGLRREHLMIELDVAGLPEGDATELMGVRIGGPLSAAFAHALYEETEGNPFFIEEIVRHLVDSGVPALGAGPHDLQRLGVPDDVKAVISRRLARLEPEAIEWLRVAAVIGRDFDASLVEQVLELDEESFLSALDEALAAGLVAESPVSRDGYSFSHALIRETLYEGMSATRRARIHRRVGVALEAAGPEHNLSALALHFARAADSGDAERSIGYALRAGRQATVMLAHEEAADHYARALEVLDRFDPRALARRLELLLALGEAQVRSGERPRAWPTFREAGALAGRLGDAAGLARAAVGAARRYLQPPGVVDTELISLLEQALRETEADRSSTRVQLLACLCGALYFSPRREEMKPLAEEASQIAAELGDPQATALAAAARRRAYWDPIHVDRRVADSGQLLEAARQAGDIELAMQGHAWLVVDLLERGQPGAVDAQIEAFQAGAVELRQPLYRWQAAVWAAMRALLAGHLESADRLAAEALAEGIRSEDVAAPQYYAVQLMGIRREQSRIGELEDAVRGVLAGSPHRPAWRAGLATLLYETGRRQEARAEFETLAGAGFADIPQDGDWMIAISLLADLAYGLGDEPRAELLYEMLIPFEQSNVVIGVAVVCLGAAARYLGRLAAAMGRRDAAIAHLEHAVESNTRLGAVVALAHTQLDLGQVLGPGSRSRSLSDAAGGTARELGLPAVLERVRRARRS